MREYTINYHQAGGANEFSDYYTAHYDNVIFSSRLKSNVVFSEHNLATDGSFNEFGFLEVRHALVTALEFIAREAVSRLKRGL